MSLQENESFSIDEKIKINDKILQLGVMFNPDENGYQLYLYPGMTVAEMAFDVMVMIRLLIKDDYIKTKKEFDDLVKKYFNDPQYRPLDDEVN